MKRIMVLTRTDNSPIALNINAIAAVEPKRTGCKVITTILTSPYEGHVRNVEYEVQEPISFIIGAMNN